MAVVVNVAAPDRLVARRDPVRDRRPGRARRLDRPRRDRHRQGRPRRSRCSGRVKATPLEIALALARPRRLVAWLAFVARRPGSGSGPLAPPPGARRAGRAPRRRRRRRRPPTGCGPGAQLGLPIVWMVVCLLVLPVAIYIASYIPWAFVENHRLFGELAGRPHRPVADRPHRRDVRLPQQPDRRRTRRRRRGGPGCSTSSRSGSTRRASPATRPPRSTTRATSSSGGSACRRSASPPGRLTPGGACRWP